MNWLRNFEYWNQHLRGQVGWNPNFIKTTSESEEISLGKFSFDFKME